MKALCAAAVLVFSACFVAEAKPVELTNEKFTIDVPDAWTVTQQPVDTYQNSSVLIFSALNADKTGALEILVCNNPHGLMADHPGLVSSVKDSISNMIVSHGGQVQFTTDSKLSINTVPAYLIQYTATAPPAPPIQARAYQLAANGKLYLISGRAVNAAADADLATIVNSIIFTTPPELPTPPVRHRRLKIALAAAVGVGGLIAIVAVVVYLRRRQEA